jgi:hypothetical protein
MSANVPKPVAPTEPAPDLADRLRRYRARVEREGRSSALERIDKAIDEAKRQAAPPRGS